MNREQDENNEQFIPGIFNYCDRWCERCAFTSKCRTFAMEEEMDIHKDGSDFSIAEFADMLENLLDATIDLLHEKAEEFGVDLDEIKDDDNFEENRKVEKLLNESTDCAVASKKYIGTVNEWFDNPKHETDELLIENNTINEKFALKIVDSIEVIRWYQHQIYVKIMRALSGKNREADEDFPNDSDGSAKVALIGIDNSISAWGNLLMNFRDNDNSIFNILLHLVDLQHAVEEQFPKARSFVRPGFDE